MSDQRKSTLILERNKDGVAIIDGETIIKVSPQRSILSYANSEFINGGYYADDGYIYDFEGNHLLFGSTKRKHMQKAYSEEDRVLVWEPIKEDLKKLEHRRWKILQAVKKFIKTIWKPAYNKILELNQAHAQVKHKYQGEKDLWWLYSICDFSGKKAITWDWVDKPNKPINLDIGNSYYYINKRLEDLLKRERKFNTAFRWALEEFTRKQEDPNGYNLNLKITINGRDYWFASVMQRSGKFSWDMRVFPENKTIEMEIP